LAETSNCWHCGGQHVYTTHRCNHCLRTFVDDYIAELDTHGDEAQRVLAAALLLVGTYWDWDTPHEGHMYGGLIQATRAYYKTLPEGDR